MSGIPNYYHGEEAMVLERRWLFTEERMTDVLLLDGDPHRNYALDYSSDIQFDPEITTGDRVVYVRLSDKCGFWCRKADMYGTRLDQAMERRARAPDVPHEYLDHVVASPLLARIWGRLAAWRRGRRAEFAREKDSPYPSKEAPQTPVSLFLSYSGRNCFLTDDLHQALTTEAKAQVWYDRERPGEAPDHDETIENWLRNAIYETQLFVVVLTGASASSRWVKNEIEWAAQKARKVPGFALIVLDVEGVAGRLPEGLARQVDHVVDCRDLWFGEIMEELYAAVYGRQGRRSWLREQSAHGFVAKQHDPRAEGYDHLRTDGGVAVQLEWFEAAGRTCWSLRYDVHGEERRVRGCEELEIVDPGIRPGDRVGCTTWQWFGKSIWMRSDAGLKPRDVMDPYHDRIHPRRRPDCRFCDRPLWNPDRLRRRSAKQWLWLGFTALCGCAVIASAFSLAWSRSIDPQTFGMWPPPTGKLLELLFAISVVAFGAYQLAWSLHAAWEERQDTKAFRLEETLWPVAWRAVIYPYIHYIAVLLAIGVLVGGPLFLARRLIGNPYPHLAWTALVIYAITILHVLYRLWLFLTSQAIRDAAMSTYSDFRYFELIALFAAVLRELRGRRRRAA